MYPKFNTALILNFKQLLYILLKSILKADQPYFNCVFNALPLLPGASGTDKQLSNRFAKTIPDKITQQKSPSKKTP